VIPACAGAANVPIVKTAQGSSDLIARDRKRVWHPYAPPMASPLFEVREASGVRLTLADGRELVDGMSSWWACIHGYRHPHIEQAIRNQLERMPHVMFGGLTHEPGVSLCERLIEMAPPGFERVFLCDSGSVSVEVGIKMALQYWLALGRPEKKRLLTVRGGYHGDTFATMAVCDPIGGMHDFFSTNLQEHLFAERPACRFEEPFEERHIADITQMLTEHRDEIAAVILEPIVQGAGGMWFYAPEYLSRLHSLCKEHGVLMILDEVATGFGRTGKLFASNHAGISSDILCVGKSLTGGTMTLAATLASDRVCEAIAGSAPGALMHGPTFMGNPLACAAAGASLDLLETEPWRERVARIEGQLREQLEPCRELAGVADVRVLGAIGVVELEAPVEMSVVQPAFVSRGVWIRPFGKLVYTMPPYIIDRADLGFITNAIHDVLQQHASPDR
jgi:adenosylmethionine-8-amino-7-oxononanoate aminotransferase